MLTDTSLMLLLLFVLAAAAGYGVARLTGRRTGGSGREPLSSEYFEGLNYLLNEQTDRAIEVFVRMVEVDSETVETHFALGSLFRRRGEVDRAIRIHQNLIARPNLPREQRQQALFELGGDYMRAGLFDRAESLFLELTDSPRYREDALRQLVTIYEQQKDWDQAIAARRKLEVITGRYQNSVIAHYHCELAELARREQGSRRVRQHLKRALAQDRDCVRASLISAELSIEGDEPRAALKQYRRVIEQDEAFVSEVLADIARCYGLLDRPKGFGEFVEELVDRRPDIRAGVALAALEHPELDDPVVTRCFLEHASTDPHLRGVYDLVRLLANAEDASTEGAATLRDAIRKLDSHTVRYRCRECGLKGTTLYWQCPSCKSWNSTRPSHEFGFSILPASLEDSGFRDSLPSPEGR